MAKHLFGTAFTWQRGVVGAGKGYSARVSVRLLFAPGDVWVGLYCKRQDSAEWWAYVCILPMLPLRLHYRRSYGGIFPTHGLGLRWRRMLRYTSR